MIRYKYTIMFFNDLFKKSKYDTVKDIDKNNKDLTYSQLLKLATSYDESNKKNEIKQPIKK